jgi:hypothetical protein
VLHSRREHSVGGEGGMMDSSTAVHTCQACFGVVQLGTGNSRRPCLLHFPAPLTDAVAANACVCLQVHEIPDRQYKLFRLCCQLARR